MLRTKQPLPLGEVAMPNGIAGEGFIVLCPLSLVLPSQARVARQLSQRESQVGRLQIRHPIVILNEVKNLQG